MPQKVYNKEQETWKRPWEVEKFDDLWERDERFFSILLKGAIGWLNRNIVLYNKSIRHFIFTTGTSYLYIEKNGYDFSWSETSGEDTIYMQLPRCVIELGSVSIPQDELTQPFIRGVYEHSYGNDLKGWNGMVRRLPVEVQLSMRYCLANFNEVLVLLQEIFDKLVFQRYFNINYLGQIIQCSLEFPDSVSPELNKVDLTSVETNIRTISFDLKIKSNYPVIDTRTEEENTTIISQYGGTVDGVSKYNAIKATDKDPNERGAIVTDIAYYGPAYRKDQGLSE